MRVEHRYINGFDQRLDKLMTDNNTNATQLGKVVGRERKTIYKWRNGDDVPNAISLMKICKYYKVKSDWLLFGEE